MKESIVTSEQKRNSDFKNWTAEFQGEIWLNRKAMPEGVYTATQMYEHWLCHGRTIESPEVIKCAEDFKRLTGYEITDFVKFQDEQKQKLNQQK